jgi:hypothetical protein
VDVETSATAADTATPLYTLIYTHGCTAAAAYRRHVTASTATWIANQTRHCLSHQVPKKERLVSQIPFNRSLECTIVVQMHGIKGLEKGLSLSFDRWAVLGLLLASQNAFGTVTCGQELGWRLVCRHAQRHARTLASSECSDEKDGHVQASEHSGDSIQHSVCRSYRDEVKPDKLD